MKTIDAPPPHSRVFSLELDRNFSISLPGYDLGEMIAKQFTPGMACLLVSQIHAGFLMLDGEVTAKEFARAVAKKFAPEVVTEKLMEVGEDEKG